MTDEELQAIKARADAATPGPWEELAESGDFWIAGPETDNNYVVDTTATDNEDTQFIIHARTDVPLLLAEIEQLHVIVAAYRDEMHKAEGQRDAEKHRADVLEQKLAAVPVDAIRGVMSDDPLGDDLDAVAAWLGIEVQP